MSRVHCNWLTRSWPLETNRQAGESPAAMRTQGRSLTQSLQFSTHKPAVPSQPIPAWEANRGFAASASHTDMPLMQVSGRARQHQRGAHLQVGSAMCGQCDARLAVQPESDLATTGTDTCSECAACQSTPEQGFPTEKLTLKALGHKQRSNETSAMRAQLDVNISRFRSCRLQFFKVKYADMDRDPRSG